MRFIDEVMQFVDAHPHLSVIEKQIIKSRLTVRPGAQEIGTARLNISKDIPDQSAWEERAGA